MDTFDDRADNDAMLIDKITECDRRYAELTDQLKAVAADRAAAYSGLVDNEKARRSQVGLTTRGAPMIVAARMNVTSAWVYTMLAAHTTNTRNAAESTRNGA